MSKLIIVLEEKISHGGSVIEGPGQALVGNKLAARIGDKTGCDEVLVASQAATTL